jgi:neutral amino acid transport system permease protein
LRRFAVLLSAALAALVLMLSVGGSAAWADGDQGFKGTLENKDANDEPVPDVEISVQSEDGTEAGRATSDADGKWEILLDEPGEYQVVLDESTLPDDLVVKNERPKLTVDLDAGQVRPALFPLGATTNAEDDAGTGSGKDGSDGGKNDDCVSDPETGEEVCSANAFDRWVRVIYDGLHFGLIIALAAMGLSLIFGTMGLTNFAHGELVTIGAAVAYMVNIGFGVPLIPAAVAAVVIGGLFGWIQDRFFWGWLRKRGVNLITMMIISIGVALALRYGTIWAMGPNTERYGEYVRQSAIDLGSIQVVPKKLIVDAIAVVVIVAVALALTYTRFGKAVRAVADNPSLASASGIDVDRVIRWVWTAGGALASLAGVALAVERGVKFDMGFKLLLLIFAGVILGGLGTAFGALVGSILIGVFTQLSTMWIEAELKYVGALLLLIIVLIVRPQGILGRRERVG